MRLGIVGLSWMLAFMVGFSSPARPEALVAECQIIRSNSSNSFPEIQGIAKGVELWALLFSSSPQNRVFANERLKIVWRMTGRGDFHLMAMHPDGTTVQPSWGPIFHGSSSWHRPGAEWGAGFIFPKPGCWRLIASRDDGIGEIQLWVEPELKFF